MGSFHGLLKTARQGSCTKGLPFDRVLEEDFATEISSFGAVATNRPYTLVCERPLIPQAFRLACSFEQTVR